MVVLVMVEVEVVGVFYQAQSQFLPILRIRLLLAQEDHKIPHQHQVQMVQILVYLIRVVEQL